MSQFKRFVTEGNERVEELAKHGAVLMREKWEDQSKQSSAAKRRGLCGLAVCNSPSLFGGGVARFFFLIT